MLIPLVSFDWVMTGNTAARAHTHTPSPYPAQLSQPAVTEGIMGVYAMLDFINSHTHTHTPVIVNVFFYLYCLTFVGL